MKIYLIPGLGADEQVFKFLELDFPSVVIVWKQPAKHESLSSYCHRLISQIDPTEKFALLGVSLGGIVAVELSKLIKPEIVILISSVMKSDQLPQKYIRLGRLLPLYLLPIFITKPPAFILNYFFSAVNTSLLSDIVNDADPVFVKWALAVICRWDSRVVIPNNIRIHGSNDRMIPLEGESIVVEKGGHFMIVDKAKEVSKILSSELGLRKFT